MADDDRAGRACLLRRSFGATLGASVDQKEDAFGFAGDALFLRAAYARVRHEREGMSSVRNGDDETLIVWPARSQASIDEQAGAAEWTGPHQFVTHADRATGGTANLAAEASFDGGGDQVRSFRSGLRQRGRCSDRRCLVDRRWFGSACGGTGNAIEASCVSYDRRRLVARPDGFAFEAVERLLTALVGRSRLTEERASSSEQHVRAAAMPNSWGPEAARAGTEASLDSKNSASTEGASDGGGSASGGALATKAAADAPASGIGRRPDSDDVAAKL